MRHWLALAKAPRLASQKHPILVLDVSLTDRLTIFTYHSTSLWQVPYPASSQTRPCLCSGCPRPVTPSARSARDGELPLCNCACPCVPPLCVACAPSVCAPSCPLCWNARIASADDIL